MTTETCPHCGAEKEKYDSGFVRYKCGSSMSRHIADDWASTLSSNCYLNQLAQKKAEIKELQSALCKYGWHETDCDFLQDELPCSCGFEQLIYPLILEVT